MAETPHRPAKLEVMRALLEHAEAQVHFDARKPGVELPQRLLSSPNVRLDYGYGLVPPIPDLSVDEDGIRATLSFNRIPFHTFVPWTAVFLIADFAGRGAVWREDLPVELAADLVPADVADPPVAITQPEMEKAVKPARRFTVVDSDDGGDDAPPQQDGAPFHHGDSDPDPEPPRPRPALRLVK